jgi:Protein of unknown function (DUF3108)
VAGRLTLPGPRLRAPQGSPAGTFSARVLLLLSVVVLLLHAFVLAWLESQWREPAALHPLTTPLFTRQIMVAAPPEPASPRKSAPPRTRTPVQRTAPAFPSVEVAPPPPPPTDTLPMPAAEPATEVTPVPAETQLPAPASNTPETAPPDDTDVSAASVPPALRHLDSWPADTRLTYRLGGHFRGELHGDARVQWQREVDRYEVQVDLDIGWLVGARLTSQGLVTPGGLAPQAYQEQVRTARRSVTLGEQAITLQNGQRVPRPEGVQDAASQFVELTHQFATGRAALVTGGTVGFWLARPGGVDPWTFDILEEITLETPRLGPVQAFHLKPRPRPSPRGPIVAEIWVAPGLQYLPVRIRISVGDSNYLDLVVERIEQR